MKLTFFFCMFSGLIVAHGPQESVVIDGRRIPPYLWRKMHMTEIPAYRYNPYGICVDRSKDRPTVKFAFVIDRFYLHVVRKNID